MRRVFIGALLVGLLAAAAWAEEAEAITFTRDVAPIIFDNCALCHRPGESAPFSLLTYRDVRKRDKQIVEVIGTGFMPPWKPERGYGEFIGQRRLTERQIATIEQWVAGGSLRGDPENLPVFEWTEGWQLGQPDLVITMPEPFELAADGRDVFRNFVIPSLTKTTRYVRAVELRPGSALVCHHGLIRVDRTRSSRQRDAADPGIGFGGMDMGLAESPDGHFLVWVPGKTPFEADPGMAWRLDPGIDLVLQLHMQPSGRVEQIQPQLGLFFADEPPTIHPTAFQIGSGEIDIPPGEKNYVVEDEFTLPVAVDVLSVFPHAHYVGRQLHGFATLPDGTKQWLIRIDDWDFNWQDEYRFREPIRLPGGSKIHMRYTYDNSEDNVRNPFYPPRRIVAGDESTDEMATLTLQVLTEDTRRKMILFEALSRRRLERNVNAAWVGHYNLGVTLQQQGRLDEAISQFRQALGERPDFLQALGNLGLALVDSGKLEEGITYYREALRRHPDAVEVNFNLGVALIRHGELIAAIDRLDHAARIMPDSAQVQYQLAIAHNRNGDATQALAHLREAARLDPDWPTPARGIEVLLSHHPELR